MGLISTPFVTYGEINVDDTDIYDDAWGFNSEFHDVIGFLGEADADPGDRLTDKLLGMISSMK